MLKPFDKEILKRRIVQARERKELNQAQLAQLAGVTPAAISQIENGLRVPSIPVLHRIADVLEVTLDFLLGKKDEVEFKDLLQHGKVEEFYRGFKGLDPEDQQTILNNIEFLKSRSKEKKEK